MQQNKIMVEFEVFMNLQICIKHSNHNVEFRTEDQTKDRNLGAYLQIGMICKFLNLIGIPGEENSSKSKGLRIEAWVSIVKTQGVEGKTKELASQ